MPVETYTVALSGTIAGLELKINECEKPRKEIVDLQRCLERFLGDLRVTDPVGITDRGKSIRLGTESRAKL